MAVYIGTYGEKTLHREIKLLLEPTGLYHEIPVGKYIADIKTESGITEVQTQSFHKLRGKLSAFLQEHSVTLVYPLAHEKHIVLLDGPEGEIVRARRSPKRGNFYAAFRELYQIKSHLNNENLTLRLMLFDVTERRAASNNRKKYHKIDTIISAFYDELTIECAEDYGRLIPCELCGQFTSRDYAIASGLNRRNAAVALNVLFHVGAVDRIGKTGNSHLYAKCFA